MYFVTNMLLVLTVNMYVQRHEFGTSRKEDREDLPVIQIERKLCRDIFSDKLKIPKLLNHTGKIVFYYMII